MQYIIVFLGCCIIKCLEPNVTLIKTLIGYNMKYCFFYCTMLFQISIYLIEKNWKKGHLVIWDKENDGQVVWANFYVPVATYI